MSDRRTKKKVDKKKNQKIKLGTKGSARKRTRYHCAMAEGRIQAANKKQVDADDPPTYVTQELKKEPPRAADHEVVGKTHAGLQEDEKTAETRMYKDS